MLLEDVQGFADSLEYEQLDDEDRGIPGLVCAAFARFLHRFQKEALRHELGERDAKTLDDAYHVIELLVETGDADVENLVVTEIFENLLGEQPVHQAFKD